MTSVNGLLALLALPALAAAAGWSASDDEGRVVQLAAPPLRIVSLSPGATAMIFAAGGGERIVGTSDYSAEPAAAARIARVSDSHGFDLERILALHPDLVVAWPGGASVAQLRPLERAGLTVYHHQVARLDDVPAAIEHFGALLDTRKIADAAAAALRTRIAQLRQRYRNSAPQGLLIQVWDRPVYTVGGGQVISDVIEACGYRNVFAELPDAAPAVTLESIATRDPEVILAIGESAASTREWLQHWQQLPALRAVRTGRLTGFADPRLSRMGPEVVSAAEELCRVLASPPTGTPAAP